MNILATTTANNDAAATAAGISILMIVPVIIAIVWTVFPFIVWTKFNAVLRQLRKMQNVSLALVAVLTLTLVGCADPAFQQYIANRQAAVARMADGPAKFYEQARLDEQILADKREKQQQAAAAAMIFAAGMANAGAAYQRATYTPIVYPINLQSHSTLGTSLNPLVVRSAGY